MQVKGKMFRNDLDLAEGEFSLIKLQTWRFVSSVVSGITRSISAA